MPMSKQPTATTSVKLDDASLAALCDYERKRADLMAQMDALAAQDEDNRLEMFGAFHKNMGIDLDRTDWALDESHRAEFGVVLLKPSESTYVDEDEEIDEELLAEFLKGEPSRATLN